MHACDMSCDYMCVISVKVDMENEEELIKIVKSTIGTKFIKKWLVN